MCQCLVLCASLVLLLTQKIRSAPALPLQSCHVNSRLLFNLHFEAQPINSPFSLCPCQRHLPNTPTGLIENVEFKLINDIWPFVKLFFPLSKLHFCRPDASQNIFVHPWKKRRGLIRKIWKLLIIYRSTCSIVHRTSQRISTTAWQETRRLISIETHDLQTDLHIICYNFSPSFWRYGR